MKAKHLWITLVACVLLLIPALLATPAQAAESIPEGLEYSISNGEVTITDYTGTATELDIPSEIVGCPVTVIGDTAFQNCESLIGIIIPEGVTVIGYQSFENCINLTDITIPLSVCDFGQIAFLGCTNLQNVYYGGELDDWCRLEFFYARWENSYDNPMTFAENLYLNGKLLAGVVEIPESIECIGTYTFLGCDDITEVIFHENVTRVGVGAFSGCKSLKKIIFKGPQPEYAYYKSAGIPVEEFGEDGCVAHHEDVARYTNVYYNCFYGVTAVAYYPSKYGVCSCKNGFGGDLTWIVYDNINEIDFTYIISNGEVTITDYTGTATELEIPSEIDGYPVTIIESSAFYQCSTLEIVTIPKSVTSMGLDVFYGCRNLKEVWLYCHPNAIIWQTVELDIMPEDCFCDDFPFCGHGRNAEWGTFACMGSYSAATSVYISADYISIDEPKLDENIKLCYLGTTEDGLEYRICSEKVVITKYFGTAAEFMIPESIFDYPVKSITDRAFSGNSALKTLVFSGEAPNISANAFAGAELTIKFPADNASWQDAAMKNYGGTLTWKPYGNPKFTAASLALKDNLNIRFSVDAAAFENGVYNSPKVVFTIGNATQTVDSYTVSEGKYIFVCDNISPSQIGDVVQAELYAIYFDDEVKLQTMEYGVATYCYNMLAKTDDDALRTLLVDLLNYGSSAQKYAGYKTASLSNSQLTEEQKSWGSGEDLELGSVLSTKYLTVNNAKATWKAAGLVLDNSVTMRFRFEADSIDNLSVKIVAAGQEWYVTEFEPDVDKDRQYYAYFSGLSARQMRESVFVTVYEGDTRVSNTLRYSVETYAFNKQNDTNVKLADLVKTMMRYGISAENYLN